jgi:hypothetical protein
VAERASLRGLEGNLEADDEAALLDVEGYPGMSEVASLRGLERAVRAAGTVRNDSGRLDASPAADERATMAGVEEYLVADGPASCLK